MRVHLDALPSGRAGIRLQTARGRIASGLSVIRSQSTVAQMEISISQADFRGSLIREELTVEGPS
jgi:hypothetical protein